MEQALRRGDLRPALECLSQHREDVEGDARLGRLRDDTASVLVGLLMADGALASLIRDLHFPAPTQEAVRRNHGEVRSWAEDAVLSMSEDELMERGAALCRRLAATFMSRVAGGDPKQHIYSLGEEEPFGSYKAIRARLKEELGVDPEEAGLFAAITEGQWAWMLEAALTPPPGVIRASERSRHRNMQEAVVACVLEAQGRPPQPWGQAGWRQALGQGAAVAPA
jgi:hypothetical protein